MTLLEEIEAKVASYLSGEYKVTKKTSVPYPENVPLGNEAAQLEATTLFIDVRQSSDITNTFRRQTAAKMMKAYFDGAVRIINKNDGAVRSFNGDGMLAIFVGDKQADQAVKSAMQVKWFVQKVLEPEFRGYFESNQKAVGQALDFSVGAGIDNGTIFAVRVGIKGTNDVAWVGRCTNTSAKLANVTKAPKSIAISGKTYNLLSDSSRTSSGGSPMWTDLEDMTIGGVDRRIRRSSFRWVVT